MIDDIDADEWKLWFAWYPIKCEGKTVWLKKIYRQKIWWYDNSSYYRYSTLFGMLKK